MHKPTFKLSFKNTKVKRKHWRHGIDERIILNWALNRMVERELHLYGSRYRHAMNYCKHGNGSSYFITGGEVIL